MHVNYFRGETRASVRRYGGRCRSGRNKGTRQSWVTWKEIAQGSFRAQERRYLNLVLVSTETWFSVAAPIKKNSIAWRAT